MGGTAQAARHRIAEMTGEGGRGVVGRDLDLHLGCTGALKEIRPEHLHDLP
jgi:hypothetical protein